MNVVEAQGLALPSVNDKSFQWPSSFRLSHNTTSSPLVRAITRVQYGCQQSAIFYVSISDSKA